MRRGVSDILSKNSTGWMLELIMKFNMKAVLHDNDRINNIFSIPLLVLVHLTQAGRVSSHYDRGSEWSVCATYSDHFTLM